MKPMDAERAAQEEHKIIVPLTTLKLFGVLLWGLHFFARITDRDYTHNTVHKTSWFMPSNDILNIMFLLPITAYGLTYRYFLEGSLRRLIVGFIKIYPRLMLMSVLLTCTSWALDRLDLYVCFWSPFGLPQEGFLTTLFGAALAGLIGPIFPIFAQHYADCFGVMCIVYWAGLLSCVAAFVFRVILKHDVKLTAIVILIIFGPMQYWPGFEIPLSMISCVAGVLLAWVHTSIKPRLSKRQTLILVPVVIICVYFHYIQRAMWALFGYYREVSGPTRIYIYTTGVCGLIHLFMANEHWINSVDLPDKFWVDKIGMPMYFFQVAIIHSYGCWFMDDFAVTEEDHFLRLVGLLTTFNVVLVTGIALHYLERPVWVWLNNRVYKRLSGDVGSCSHGHYPFHSECIEQHK